MTEQSGPDILSASDGKLVLKLNQGLYPLDAIYGAAYVFIDRAYIMLGRDDDATIIEMHSKDSGASEEALRALAGDFANELLSETLRQRITSSNQSILETIVSRALAGASGSAMPSAFDDDDDDDLDFLDDPLGIAVPWEERFKKSGSEPTKKGPDAERAAGPGDAGGHDATGGDSA